MNTFRRPQAASTVAEQSSTPSAAGLEHITGRGVLALAAKRAGVFLAIMVIAPPMAALVAAWFHTGSHLSLVGPVIKRAPFFFSETVVRALSASAAFSLLLALLSFGAWKPSGLIQDLVRVLRLELSIWIMAFIAFPGLGGWVPLVRHLPLWTDLALVGATTAALYIPRKWRPNWREAALIVFAFVLLCFSPTLPRQSLNAIAKRPFDARDVILIGIDSLSYSDVSQFLHEYEPRNGEKIVFANAWTPIAMTSGSWRALLTGRYPDPSMNLPGMILPSEPSAWLPAQVRQLGYTPVMFQDAPATNSFRQSEGVEIPSVQGWRFVLRDFVWKAAFPLSTVAGRWWLRLAGGPADDPGRYGYCARCYQDEMLETMAERANGGPLFWMTHTCYAHPPIRLSLSEVWSMPGWWKYSPRELEVGGNILYDHGAEGRSSAVKARNVSVRNTIRLLLEQLDDEGVLGRAHVFLFSDHGPRQTWNTPAEKNHVMLAGFLPGPRISTVVNSPVSLIDIAPTVREILGLKASASDGATLPIHGRSSALRGIRTIEGATEESVGIGAEQVSGELLDEALQLEDDGTFTYKEAFLRNVRERQQVGTEHRTSSSVPNEEQSPNDEPIPPS